MLIKHHRGGLVSPDLLTDCNGEEANVRHGEVGQVEIGDCSHRFHAEHDE